jgi:hypothetical protein
MVQWVLEELEGSTEHRVADRRLAEGSMIAASFGSFLRAGWYRSTSRAEPPGAGQGVWEARICGAKNVAFCTWSAKPMGRQLSPRVTYFPRISLLARNRGFHMRKTTPANPSRVNV